MKLAGYAARYNSPAVIGGPFEEIIAPGAFREAVTRDDCRCLFNHDNNIVLGRKRSGTLTLHEDSQGLFYEVTLNPDDPTAMGVGAAVARKDITGSSFQFKLDPEDDEWLPPAKPGGLPRRTLRRLGLVDVSPVTFPAYEAASVAARETDIKSAEAISEREHLQLKIAIARARAWECPQGLR